MAKIRASSRYHSSTHSQKVQEEVDAFFNTTSMFSAPDEYKQPRIFAKGWAKQHPTTGHWISAAIAPRPGKKDEVEIMLCSKKPWAPNGRGGWKFSDGRTTVACLSLGRLVTLVYGEDKKSQLIRERFANQMALVFNIPPKQVKGFHRRLYDTLAWAATYYEQFATDVLVVYYTINMKAEAVASFQLETKVEGKVVQSVEKEITADRKVRTVGDKTLKGVIGNA